MRHPVLRKSRLGNARSATCSISLSRVSKTPWPQENRPGRWTDIFGNCESINLYPGLHAGVVFDFTYRGIPIGICNYDWYDNRTWYDFFFETKNEADQFYNDLVNDIRDAGIPLTKDNLYGGMSNSKKPVFVFKWVSVDAPVKVKEVSPSNIETADHVGKYKVELGVMKTKR